MIIVHTAEEYYDVLREWTTQGDVCFAHGIQRIPLDLSVKEDAIKALKESGATAFVFVPPTKSDPIMANINREKARASAGRIISAMMDKSFDSDEVWDKRKDNE